MSVESPQYIARIAVSLSAIYGIVYIVSAVAVPKFFLSSMAINRTDHRKGDRRHPWWLWPLAFFTAVCVGMVIYGALYPAVAAIPFSWGSHDEDGEWTSTRDYVRLTAALIGAIGLISCLEKVAEVLIWGPIERRARDALADAITHYRTDGDRVRDAAIRNLDKKLGPDEYEFKTPETEWRDDLREAIRRRLTSSF